MSERTAKGLVTLAAVGMFAIIGLRRNSLTDPFKQAWAVGVVYVGLSLLADISPEVAGPLAVLVLIAVWAKTGKGGSLIGSAGSNASGSTIIAPSTGG